MTDQEVGEAFEQRARVTKALSAVCDTVVETVNEAGDLGVPGGHLYAAMMTIGMSLGTFEQIMAALVKAGKVRKAGECYHSVAASVQ